MAGATNINKPYHACLFDLDGTLIDSSAPIIASTRAALAELDWPAVDDQVIRAHIGYKLEAIFPQRTLAERAGLIDAIGRHYDAICAEQTVLFPHIRPLLDDLRARGVPMAVITSKRRGHTETILKALGIRTHFQLVLGVEDVAVMKPDPEGLIAALAALKITAANALYVGDTHVDVQTARAAGMAVAGVAWGTDGPERLAQAGIDHAIASPEAIGRLF